MNTLKKEQEMLPMQLAFKLDDNKPPLGLIPRSALTEEAAVMGHGAVKYGAHNWRKGMAWSKYIDAAQRHILAWNEGEDLDAESGLHHLAHARCNLAFLIEYMVSCPELDDRHTTEYTRRKDDVR